MFVVFERRTYEETEGVEEVEVKKRRTRKRAKHSIRTSESEVRSVAWRSDQHKRSAVLGLVGK